MIQLVLDAEQARLVADAHEAVEVCDSEGKPLGVLSPVSSSDVAEAQRRLSSPEGDWMSTEEVLQKLKTE